MKTPRSPGRILAAIAITIFVVLVIGRSAAIFYTDALWFDAVGQGAVFWKRFGTILTIRAITTVVAGSFILANLWYVLRHFGPVHLRRRYGNIEIAEQVPRRLLMTGATVIAVLAGWWLATVQFGGLIPVAVLAWLRAEDWGVVDPLFQHDISFYVFALPIYIRVLDFLMFTVSWSLVLASIGYVLVGAVRSRGRQIHIDERPRVHFAVLIAVLMVLIGARFAIGRYELLVDGNGFNDAIGYTDVHARLPAHILVALLCVATAAAVLYGAIRRTLLPPTIAVGGLAIGGIASMVLYPAFVQRVQVEPNEIGREAEYISWNMDFTRRAFGVNDIERRTFNYRRPDAETWTRMAPALAQLPLWDLAPLEKLFNEIEGRQGYYRFTGVSYDRYRQDSVLRHVAVGVREIYQQGLPEAAQTWQNKHMTPAATRGIGAVVTPTNETTGGDPTYWLAELNPVRRHEAAPAALELSQPSIYFGESTTEDYVVVGHEGRFDTDSMIAAGPPVPRVTTGVPLSSFVRVLAFSWAFNDYNLLFSRALGDTSRILFVRAVQDRVRAIAPFILWDEDAQPVILDGRVVWMLDGYSVSTNYPLSRAALLSEGRAVRYLHSSVKATVDAVTGEVAIYSIGPPDPIVRTYAGIFPGLIRNGEEMPEALRAHLRYPPLLFGVQSSILQQYHLNRAATFYAGQEVWELPQELSPEMQRRLRPAFATMPMPGSTQPEYLLLNPFIARERQNLTALLIARSDPPNYGKLVLLEMPRDDQIRGPAQVQSIIEQDPVISQQLSLWRQQGSNAELGRLRIVPTDSSLLYIEPLYLSAQAGAIPQLQRVIATDGTAVTMEVDLETAVAALRGETARSPVRNGAPEAPRPAADEWTQRALDLMREADARLRAGDFAGFGNAWARLRTLLEQRDQQPVPR